MAPQWKTWELALNRLIDNLKGTAKPCVLSRAHAALYLSLLQRRVRSCVLFAATPKPSGTSDMEKITTPWFAGVFSVMRPRPDLSKWLP